MPDIKKKQAPSVDSNQRAWTNVYDDINDIINSVNQKSAVESRNGASGLDGDIRLFKDVDKTKYFIEGKFSDGWAKRELLFSDKSNETQDESINFSATESYVKPDGTVPFTAKQSGISPTNTAHLATKGYVDGATHASVTLAGSLDYITLSGQELTRNAIDLSTDITGTLPINKGGTNNTSFTTGKLLQYSNGTINSSSITPGSLLTDVIDTAATPGTGGQHGNLPSNHVCLIEDSGASATQAKIYNVKSNDNSRLVITDSEEGDSAFIEFDVKDQTGNINRFDRIYAEDTEDVTTSDTAASGGSGLVFQDTEDTTWTIGNLTNGKAEVSLVVDGFLASNHAASNVTTTRISNWDTAFGWGNHATENYLKKLEDTAATSGSLPSGHVALIEDYGPNADTAKIYNVVSADTAKLTIEDGEDGSGNSYIEFDVKDQSTSINRFHAIYTEDEENNTTSTGTAGGADAIVFQDTATTTWTTAAPVNNKVEVSLVVDHPANTNTTYSVSIPTSTTKLRLTAGGSGSGTDDIEFVGTGATSVTRTNEDKFTFHSQNTTNISSTNANTDTGHPDFYSLVEDNDTVMALKEGTGISFDTGSGDNGDVVIINSTVSTSGLLTNGLYLVEAYEDDAVTTTATASGADKLRFIQTDDIEWVISGPSADVITITPTINFPADDDTITRVREDSGTYRTGDLTLQSGSNVTITEPSTGVFNIASSDQYTGTVTGTGSANKYARWTGGSVLEYRSNAQVRSDLGISDNEIIDWTTDQGSTNIHSGNYTDTNTTDIASTNATTTTGTNDFYTLLEDSDTIRALREGSGINIEIDGGASAGDAIKISSTVDVSGLLTNGLVKVEDWNGGEVTNECSASGPDTLRFADNDGIEWAISGPTSNTITVTPSLSGYNATNWNSAYNGGNTRYTLPSTVIHESELSSSVSSTSTTVAANSAAVKSAYDRSWPNDNYYLDGITKNANTLTFSNSGGASYDKTYQFGSNAFTSFTDHSTQNYLTSHQDISGKANLSGAAFTGAITAYGYNLIVSEDSTNNIHGGIRHVETGRVDLGWGGANGGNIEIYSKHHSNRAGNFQLIYGDSTTADGSSGEFKFLHRHSSGWNSTALLTDQGNWHVDADVYAYSSSVGSDRKLKKNIKDIKYGLSDVLKLRGVDFDWKEKREGVHDIGVIAQEVREVIPEVVKEVKDLVEESYLSVDYSKLVPVLIESIKELKQEIDTIKKGIKK